MNFGERLKWNPSSSICSWQNARHLQISKAPNSRTKVTFVVWKQTKILNEVARVPIRFRLNLWLAIRIVPLKIRSREAIVDSAMFYQPQNQELLQMDEMAIEIHLYYFFPSMVYCLKTRIKRIGESKRKLSRKSLILTNSCLKSYEVLSINPRED